MRRITEDCTGKVSFYVRDTENFLIPDKLSIEKVSCVTLIELLVNDCSSHNGGTSKVPIICAKFD
jgi:hypothetical protein